MGESDLSLRAAFGLAVPLTEMDATVGFHLSMGLAGRVTGRWGYTAIGSCGPYGDDGRIMLLGADILWLGFGDELNVIALPLTLEWRATP